jgi:hypothetical protein
MNRLIKLLALLAVLDGCGGNYSNEDLDFQLALPAEEDLAVKLPVTVEIPDPAEYYKITRDVVGTFNRIAAAFLDLIDAVRAFPPSERQPGHRQWGPVPVREHPGWQARVVIDRDPGDGLPASFRYTVDVRAAGSPTWISLIVGSVRSSGGVRRGDGQMSLDTTAARAAGYPLDGLAAWQTLTIDYRNTTFPLSSQMTLVDYPGGQRFVYSYLENADASGGMTYDFPTPQLAPFAELVRIGSRWLATGAGRADMQVLNGLRGRARGIDCWAADTRATYVFRELEPAKNSGDAATCAIAPAP